MVAPCCQTHYPSSKSVKCQYTILIIVLNVMDYLCDVEMGLNRVCVCVSSVSRHTNKMKYYNMINFSSTIHINARGSCIISPESENSTIYFFVRIANLSHSIMYRDVCNFRLMNTKSLIKQFFNDPKKAQKPRSITTIYTDSLK